MQKRRQRQTTYLAIKTPLCRICGAEDPEPTEVPGGSVCLCSACRASLENGRLDVMLAVPETHPVKNGKMPAFGSPIVAASFDGGRWHKVSYTALINGRNPLSPFESKDAGGAELYRAGVNASAKAAAERRRRKAAKPRAPKKTNARPIMVDGTKEFPTLAAAAAFLGTAPSTVHNAINRGNGRCKGHTVGYKGCPPKERPKAVVDMRGRSRPVVVDGITFPTLHRAAKAAGISPTTLKRYLDSGRREGFGHTFSDAEGGAA